MRLGVIDIGSNTVRLVIWDIYGKGFYRINDEIKETLRIGENIENDLIPEEKVNSLVETLKRFKNFTENLKTDRVISVATETIRNATNREDILKRIKESTGFEPVVLANEAEAYLNFKGITGSMHVTNSLMIDITGTSTSLVWIKNNERVETAYLPFGTITLTRKFNLNQIVSAKDHMNLDDFLFEHLSKIEWLKKANFRTIILSGGSARTIGRIDRHKKRYPLSLTHNYSLSDLDINQMYYSVLTKDIKQRDKIDGLNRDRSDIILGALSIIHSVIRLTKVQELRISGKGLREGILYEHIFATMEYIPDMLDSTIYSILARHDIELPHSEQVTRLTLSMFDQLKNYLKLDDDYRMIAKTASMLHDVGSSIRFYDHEKHSFYIIVNSEVNGLNHKEILLSAFAASYHRRNNMDLTIAHFSQLVNKLDVLNAQKIGLLLAIAESLDKNMNSIVEEIEVEITDESIILRPHAPVDITMEIIEAGFVSEKFHEIFKRSLKIEPIITIK